MKIFFSYPHGDNAQLVERIKQDLEARGHEVWFDIAEIKTGDDWRNRITRGILESQQVVAFLSKHSVRDPGVCLNEIAIALADKGDAIVTILVEPEEEVNTPVSITHIQWLRMENWASQLDNEGWYQTRFEKLVDAIENPVNAGRHEELETLRLALDPISFHADIAPHIPQFTGRKWIIDRYLQWLAEDIKSRVFRIEGGPGLGKTAVSSFLAHSTKGSVLAVHLCQYNKGESRNPLRFVRTLAYQLATRLPDYRARLLKSVAIQRPEIMQGKDPASLWSDLISNNLSAKGDKGLIDRQRLAIIIDGLDEATVDGDNPIVKLLAEEISKLPQWIGVVLTGRPDPELTQRLARFHPLVLREDDPANLTDLKDYCDQWLAGEIKNQTLTPDQAAATSQTLLTNSHGAFLYLSQARIAVAEGILDLTQPDTFPSGLAEIYLRFFERRFPDASSDTSQFKIRVLPFLKLVLASPEPLPLSLATEILQWDDEDEEKNRILQALGSLIQRNQGGLAGKDEETIAPFHNSVREWLSNADAAGNFFVSTKKSRVELTCAVWQHYLASKEQDAYAWVVLPELLPYLSPSQQNQLLGAPSWEINQILYRLADCLAHKLRFSEAEAMWGVRINMSQRLSDTAPENADFARDLSISYNKLGDIEVSLGHAETALDYFRQGLSIRQRLSSAAPENADFARDLSMSYNKLGDIEVSLGHDWAALGYFRQALSIARRLSEAAPEHVPGQSHECHCR
jgi:tetratricopeptide (TPR) repeat protein